MESSGLQRLQGHYPHYHYHYLTPISEHPSQINMTLVSVFCADRLASLHWDLLDHDGWWPLSYPTDPVGEEEAEWLENGKPSIDIPPL